MPRRIRSKGPRRRIKPSPEFIRTTSDELLSGLVLRAEEQNCEKIDEREESLMFKFWSPESCRNCSPEKR
ncbi:hypothetical protein HanPSC8_Chr03g0134031 [Helianthus annuus]|nr:hypothetical protein HanPSC8_Chr03g0134031 [Helianthus annuus]